MTTSDAQWFDLTDDHGVLELHERLTASIGLELHERLTDGIGLSVRRSGDRRAGVGIALRAYSSGASALASEMQRPPASGDAPLVGT